MSRAQTRQQDTHNQDTQSASLSDEPEPGFDQIQDSVFTCAHRNLDVINISFPVSDY